VLFGEGGQPPPGAQKQFSLLGWRHARRRTAKVHPTAGSHLDKKQEFALLYDQVKFTKGAA
jgi:hypothetical protein